MPLRLQPRASIAAACAISAVLLCFAACPAADPCARYGVVHASGARDHVATCGDPACGNGLDPPNAGPHCGITAACQVFSSPQPPCEWIHNLEHGHVVLAYNCPSGCPEIVAGLQQVWTEAASPKRILVTPDPAMGHAVAAIVWGTSWSGDQLDLDAIRCVAALQDVDAPEPGLPCQQ